MRKSIATMVGSVLYIDGRIFGYDLTPDEAAEYIQSLEGQPGAPTQVVFNFEKPKKRKRKASQVGWPQG